MKMKRTVNKQAYFRQYQPAVALIKPSTNQTTKDAKNAEKQSRLRRPAEAGVTATHRRKAALPAA
jgi:hypothetical protein